ncbi:hypothetical protein GPECTOR_52g9 [Gonium pectorale]|uniref:Uncharacterized protein n=1 Tax=Gonium pectorale TaxID=33097 RepID=A0A150G785_GONPE|nr:hypothetical protein GPECTOR_52g9 [Gonium pectorale]|eukprot:KXZ45681.1 hypothetical protein GPECTOR_52g9 [Gonium pectorale]
MPLSLTLSRSRIQLFAPCDAAEAARTGGRVGAHRTSNLARKRYGRVADLFPCKTVWPRGTSCSPSSPLRASPASSSSSSRRRYRAPASLRLRALPPSLLSGSPTYSRPPMLIGDVLAYPDLAAGLDLEALPLWASLLGLLAANVAGLALTLAVLRGLQDASEPLTVVKVQVAMLERRPQLQSKLAELSSMIQVGQQGSWLILEEAVLQLLQHQGTIAYGSVSREQLSSKKRAYTAFGEIAEAEAAKANREEAVVRHMGETMDEDGAPPSARRGGAGGLLDGIMDGLGLGAPPAKELMIVTLVVAARGQLNIQDEVSDWPGLRHTLQQLTGLSSDRIMALELLWTPRKETDYLTRSQLERDYPELRPLGPKSNSGSSSAGTGAAAPSGRR